MVTDLKLEEIISPLLEEMHLTIVEMSIGHHRGDVKVNLVLFKEGGISLEELTKAQKIIRPRLELEFDRDELSMEISSPGISRVLKSHHEYQIFVGSRIRLLIDEEWIEGTLKGSGDSSISFESDNEVLDIPVNRIRKAKLA